MTSTLFAAYERLVLAHPARVLIVMLAVLGFFAWQARHFELDASADALLLEADRDLQTLREVQARYGSKDLLIVTSTPGGSVFDESSLTQLRTLRDRLRAVPGVASVTSILDVPLLDNAEGVSLSAIADNIRTLDDPETDRARAGQELIASPLFGEVIVSADARTTALALTMKDDGAYRALLTKRNRLLIERTAENLDDAGRAEIDAALEGIKPFYESAKRRVAANRRAEIAAIRGVLSDFAGTGTLHLGGVPMIADDMITFVRNDLIVFGIGVALFLVIVLSVIFREARWVVLPLAGCFYAGLLMIGMLGLVGWKVTVISSNFLALMLIITISMNIHLTVRYRQLHRDFPDLSHRHLVATTIRRMVWPCLYTALTTIIGFGSLVFSGIKPVIDFGWMMSIGLAVTFVTAFTLFPAIVLLLGRTGAPERAGAEYRFTRGLALVAERHGAVVLAAAGVLLAVCAVGVSRLTVENSFVDYFSEDTEIYQGLALIDRELGGTTPLEILLDLDEDRIFDDEPSPKPTEYDAEAEREKAGYWFTDFKIERIKEVHDWLASQPEVGKVLSLASLIRVGEKLNDGEPLDSLQLALVYRRAPADLRQGLIDPYIDILRDEARISLRIRDTLPDLHRQELLERIRKGLRDELGLGPDDVTVSGLLVLYNNMLQSLFASQISTLGAVLIGVALMLLLLFRSFTLAVLGIVPNLLAAGAVLGTMGLLSIPLDLMTITVAAVTIGIAVDNAIHYIYRFREEFARSGDYTATMHVCHANIGKAVFYTSATIIFGFSILVLSNFLPTIYFGLLTGLAMCIALLAALTLLPKLILLTNGHPSARAESGRGSTKAPQSVMKSLHRWSLIYAWTSARCGPVCAVAATALAAGRTGHTTDPSRRQRQPVSRGDTPMKPGNIIHRAVTAVAVGLLVLATATPAGALTVYTAVEAEDLKKYADRFNEDHPNIEIKWVRDSTGIVTAKLLAEKNNPKADVIWGLAATSLLLMKSEGMLDPYKPKGIERLDPKFVDKDDPPAWTGMDAWVASVCVNTVEQAKHGFATPTSWKDLTKPEYKGHVAMPNPNSSGTGFLDVSSWLQIFGEEGGWQFMDALHENIHHYTHSGSKPCKQAARGEVPIGVSFAFRGAKSKAQGAPIDIIVPSEGIGWDMEATAIVKGTKNLEEAKTLADWSISEKANMMYNEGYAVIGISELAKPVEHFPDGILEAMIDNDFEFAANNRKRILAEWQKRFDSKSEAK